MPRLFAALVCLLAAPAAGQTAAQPEAGAGLDRPASDADAVQQLLPEGDSEFDPIGTGDTASLRHVRPPERPTVDESHLGPAPPLAEIQSGEIVRAIAGVRIREHRIHVHLVDGLAVVDERLHFHSRARHPAEVRVHLAVPEGTSVAHLQVCRDAAAGERRTESTEQRCRTALPGSADAYDEVVRARSPGTRPPPVARARPVSGALQLDVAPVERGVPMFVHLRWVAPLAIRGGVARLDIPRRGNDLRAVEMQVTLSTEGLLVPTLQDAPAGAGTVVNIRPWDELQASAQVPAGGAPQIVAHRFACAPTDGSPQCARVFATAGPRPAERQDVVLLLDVSPSTFGPARGRTPAAIAALLRTLPPESRVRAVAFAGRAQALIEEPTAPADVPMMAMGSLGGAVVANGGTTSLGAATRFDAAWAVVRPWLASARRGHPLHLVVVGDGGLTRGPDADRALRAARQAGVRMSVLNLGDRPATGQLVEAARSFGGIVANVGPEADLAARGRDTRRLEEALASLFAPQVGGDVTVRVGRDSIVLPAMRAGESRVWQGPATGLLTAQHGRQRIRLRRPATETPSWAAAIGSAVTGQDTWTAIAREDRATVTAESAAQCDPRGPAMRAGGISSDEHPVAPAGPRACVPPPPAPVQRSLGRGVPAETVLSMLRQRMVPASRACFRRDRAGRRDYAVRVVFHFELADGEVVLADVSGEIQPALRSCLLDTLDRLEVPRFEGTIIVRWPVHTERDVPTVTWELRGDVADAVDQALGDDRNTGTPEI